MITRTAYLLSLKEMRKISISHCPYCNSAAIVAMTPKKMVAALFLLRLVKCHTCSKQHYRPLFMRTPEPRPQRSV